MEIIDIVTDIEEGVSVSLFPETDGFTSSDIWDGVAAHVQAVRGLKVDVLTALIGGYIYGAL